MPVVVSGLRFDGFKVDLLEAFSRQRGVDLADVVNVELDADQL